MNNGELKVFPIAKSTELLYLNTTDFAPFAEATGVTYADLSTVEGLNEAAHKYYDWTDAQTAAPNDGKALYGRDALTNYLLCGAQELGTTIFDAENGVMTLHFDKPTSASCGITTMSPTSRAGAVPAASSAATISKPAACWPMSVPPPALPSSPRRC